MLVPLVYSTFLYERIGRVSYVASGSPPGGTTYLLLGSDSRAFVKTADDRRRYGAADGPTGTPGQRADVVIALRIPDHGPARLLKIPRDLLVVGSQGGLVRLTFGLMESPQAVADSLCRTLGLGADHLMVLRLEGLRAIVNAVGGIEVTSDEPARDHESGLLLHAGVNLLDGDGALAYVGSRRMEVQRNGQWAVDPARGADRAGRAADVLTQIGRHARPSPWHPLRSNDVLWAISGSVTADDSLGIGDLLDLAGASGALSGGQTTALPVDVTPQQEFDIDNLAAGAGRVLRDFEGSSHPAKQCAEPALAAARRPS